MKTCREVVELLFEGRIYVDKEDFAIARMEGSPAKKPSFWTTDIDFVPEFHRPASCAFSARLEAVTCTVKGK